MSRVTTLRRGGPPRVAMLSVHTSPLHQPGTGDAGGLNVYVVELSRQLAALGLQVEVFTRATSAGLPPVVELADGVLVRHVDAGPYEGLDKQDLPAQLCAFTAGVLRVEAAHDRGYFDLVHSHYWLSGHVGWLAAERWGVPLVHSAHTLAKVKNLALAEGDEPEPAVREIGELQVVQAADRLLASTADEAAALVDLYGADPARVATVAPGVNLELFTPGDRRAALRRLGLPDDALVLAFAGRIQPLKAPDVVVAAAARLLADPTLPADVRERVRVLVVGGPSGRSGATTPLTELAASLGIADRLHVLPPLPQAELADVYRAATVTLVPSYSESFGLVALESQACGTPVVAAAVGGLRRAVADGRSGLLVEGHDPTDYAAAVARLLSSAGLAQRLAEGALAHARGFGWAATAAGALEAYDAARRERRPDPQAALA